MRTIRAVILGDKAQWWAKPLAIAIIVVVAILWWFYGADWISKPGTYRVGIAYGVVVFGALVFHLKALIEYAHMVSVTREAEKAGVLDAGAILYALNQRFRYAARALESTFGVGLVALTIIQVHHPVILANPNYARYVLTYFFGTVVMTAYLTIRDLQLVRAQKARNERYNGHGVV